MRVQPHMFPARIIVDIVVPDADGLGVDGGREACFAFGADVCHGLGGPFSSPPSRSWVGGREGGGKLVSWMQMQMLRGAWRGGIG